MWRLRIGHLISPTNYTADLWHHGHIIRKFTSSQKFIWWAHQSVVSATMETPSDPDYYTHESCVGFKVQREYGNVLPYNGHEHDEYSFQVCSNNVHRGVLIVPGHYRDAIASQITGNSILLKGILKKYHHIMDKNIRSGYLNCILIMYAVMPHRPYGVLHHISKCSTTCLG